MADGAEAILLGCTEIDLLIGPEDAPVPVFDTTRIHIERAVELACYMLISMHSPISTLPPLARTGQPSDLAAASSRLSAWIRL